MGQDLTQQVRYQRAMNIDTHEIKPWDDLTIEEQRSGRWKRIEPDVVPVNRSREEARRVQQARHAAEKRDLA